MWKVESTVNKKLNEIVAEALENALDNGYRMLLIAAPLYVAEDLSRYCSEVESEKIEDICEAVIAWQLGKAEAAEEVIRVLRRNHQRPDNTTIVINLG
jgi:hypothetical protein